MADDSFHITTYRAAATLQVVDGSELKGEFSCHRSAPDHPGPETITELLNEPSRFVPFFPEGDAERPILLNKDHIAVISVVEPDTARRSSFPPVDELEERRGVSLMLLGGHQIDGVLRVAAPEGHTRTQDSLNDAGRFISLESTRGELIVNLDQVVLAADPDGD